MPKSYPAALPENLTAPYAGQSLDELMAEAQRRFDVVFEPVGVGGETYEILQIADMAAHVDKLAETAGTDGLTLPFWARIWPAALLVSHFVASLAPAENATALEIGAGVGLVGLVAAKKGYASVISDIEDDALLFSQINILKNGLEDRAVAARMDFAPETPADGPRYDLILGAEVLYREEHARPLVKFLLRHLAAKPEAEAVLGREYHRKAKKFFKEAEKEFAIAEKVIGCMATNEAGEKERTLCAVNRFKPKKSLA